MDALPVSLLLAVEDGVLVLGQHLGLGGHRLLPRLEGGERVALLGERGVEGRDDRVDGPEPPSLPGLLEARQSPGSLPAMIGTNTNGQLLCSMMRPIYCLLIDFVVSRSPPPSPSSAE